MSPLRGVVDPGNAAAGFAVIAVSHAGVMPNHTPTGVSAMKRMILAAALGCLLAYPAAAAVSPKVQAAIKTLNALAGNAGHMKGLCPILKEFESADDDDAKMKPIEEKLRAYLRKIGADYENAWNLVEETNPETEDGKAIQSALDQLEDKCGK
jgi:hypothetical protein